MQTLRSSRTAELSTDAKRSRALLEARALSELSRGDLAIDLIATETGPDVERLRADILWHSRNWRAAGEQYERMVGDAWKRAEPLSTASRADVMRAALAYVLSEDPLSLERLRGKLSPKMADSEDARAFAVLTGPSGSRATEYRDLAKSLAGADTLSRIPDGISEALSGRFRLRLRMKPRAPSGEQ